MKLVSKILALLLCLALPNGAQAAKSLVSNSYGGVAAISTGQIGYFLPFLTQLNYQLTEGATNLTVRAAGTASNIYVRVISNTSNATSTYRTRKNGANGNQSVSIPATTSGEFQDATNTDALSAADTFSLSIDNSAGTGDVSVQVMSYLFDASSNTVSMPATAFGVTLGAVIFNATKWFTVMGDMAVELVTENNVKAEINTAGTFKNLYIYLTSNARAVVDTYRLRVNGANGNLVISTIASTSGIYEDTTHSDAVVANDVVNYSVTGGASVSSANLSVFAVNFETTNSNFLLGGGATDQGPIVANGETSYYGLGFGFFNEATEVNVSSNALAAFNFQNLWIDVTLNAATSTSTFDLRKNQSSTSMPTISIGAASTGYFEDTSTVASFGATDEGNFRFVNGGGGAITFRMATLLGSIQASSCPKTRTLLGVGC